MRTITCAAWACIVAAAVVNSQTISESLNVFGLDLLRETTKEAGESVNFALSTYSVWALMLLMSEGSRGNTLKQIENALKLPSNKNVLRNDFRNLTTILTTKSDGVNVELNTGIFTNSDFPVKKSFEDISKYIYVTTVMPVNFGNPVQAEAVINKFVATATHNRIQKFVNQADVAYVQVMIASVLFFKGQWKMPFKKNETHREPFYNEQNKMIGEVDMMFQRGVFPFVRLEDLNANAIELPYGNDKTMSMIVVLPFKGVTVAEVLNSLNEKSFDHIIQLLEDSELTYMDEDVHVYLPRFKIVSDFTLNIVLSRMGIRDLFDLETADLLGMFDQYLYLSKLIQRSEIEVNEEGTIATAAAGAAFPNKSLPPKLKVNRPFLYFIVNKPTKTIVFTGKVSNPNTLA